MADPLEPSQTKVMQITLVLPQHRRIQSLQPVREGTGLHQAGGGGLAQGLGI